MAPKAMKKTKQKTKAMKTPRAFQRRNLASLKVGDAFILNDGESTSFGITKGSFLKVVLLHGGARDGFVMCGVLNPAQMRPPSVEGPLGRDGQTHFIWLPRNIRSLEVGGVLHGYNPVALPDWVK